jgi:predicted PurR-regulated permease PerM
MDLSRDFERYAVIAALVLLVVGCYLVVRPFLTAFLWGGIIATSTYGIYYRLLHALGERRGLAATLTTLGLTATLLVPIATLGVGVANLLELLGEASATVREVPVFAMHTRIGEAARALGFRQIVVTDSGDEGLLRGMMMFFSGPAAGG